MQTIQNAIDGRKVTSSSRRLAPVYDPATGDQTADLPLSTVEEVNSAVAAAKKAAVGWGTMPPLKRIKPIFRFKELLDRNADEIARTISKEHGKTHADALGELARGIDVVDFACGIPHLLKGEYSRNVGPEIDSWSDRQPLGVVAGITPFNFPAMVPMWMYPVAIACGNTFILKPSERDPSTSMLIWDLFQEAGFPPGVLNVVHGDKEAVDAILDHPDIKAVSFVGSTPVAEYVYTRGTASAKRVQALGGAKNHMIVMPDADLDQAVDALMGAGFGSAGERCMAISVVVAVGAVADPLVSAIRERIARIKVGPGMEAGNEMGPLITREHRDHVASYVASAASEGATVAVDGRQDIATKSNGFFLGASLLDQVQPGMNCYRDEIFGPVLGVVRVNTYDEALRLINDNPYGNGVAIFTRDGGAARQFQFDVDAGMVGINVPIPVPVAYYSFGGWKASLFGDLHMYGPEGMQFYTKSKVVTSRWPDPGTSKMDLGFPQSR
jgi:malonate-semialdehyde dehydrogenase (acetylating)/methylmalonate-semialdehyde dehydrogenase